MDKMSFKYHSGEQNWGTMLNCLVALLTYFIDCDNYIFLFGQVFKS